MRTPKPNFPLEAVLAGEILRHVNSGEVPVLSRNDDKEDKTIVAAKTGQTVPKKDRPN